MATILTFLKPGKSPDSPNSYRPIALTSCVGKLLERIVKTRLMMHLEANGTLSPVQYGFRRCRPTTDALFRLQSSFMENKLDRKHTVCVFSDLHKAYDTTWRIGILEEMQRLGIGGNLAVYIQNFLSTRRFKVKIGNAYSDTRVQVEGLPQGSVLICSLFLLAMNGILSSIPENIFSSLYVDDLMICASSSYLPALTRRLQNQINQLATWS